MAKENIIVQQDVERIKARSAAIDGMLNQLENCPECIKEKREEKHIISKKFNMGCPIHEVK